MTGNVRLGQRQGQILCPDELATARFEVLSHWLNMDFLDLVCRYILCLSPQRRKLLKGGTEIYFQKSKVSQSTEADDFLINIH